MRDPVKHAAYMRQWAAENPEKVKRWAKRNYRRRRKQRLAKMAARYRKDPVYREYCKRKTREWRQAHPNWKRRSDSGRRYLAKQFVKQYLETHPCVDCGERDPVVLDFDHRDPRKKRYCIGAGWASGILPKSLIREMRKCDVRCSNCHRKRHAAIFHQEKRNCSTSNHWATACC